MNTAVQAQDNTHWSSLWESGALHSCGHGLEGNYDGPIAQYWIRHFNKVRRNGVVADLGTGNGALLLLAHRIRPDLQLHGIDLASIDPARHCPADAAAYQNIIFHSGCSMDRLPFADSSIDLVVSQYGFEYGPAPGTLHEILRCLAPSGSLGLLLHGQDSGIWRTTQLQLAAAHSIDASGVFIHARRLIEILLSSPGQQRQKLAENPQAEQRRHAFNQAASELFEDDRGIAQSPLFQQAVQCLSSAIGLASQGDPRATAILHNGLRRIEQQALRLQDFQRAVLDDSARHALIEQLRDHGLQASSTTLDYEGQHMGHCIDAFP